MDCVMINQLPELVIPKNRTFTPPSVNMTVNSAVEKRNPYVTKWYVLFNDKNDQWISFQPQIGHVVYPCYACRDMFGSRNSFLDHVNRRGLILKYRCTDCAKLKTYYNTCSFLLHIRDHFSDSGGTIDLDNVEISTIPMDIAGFIPIPNIPRLYDIGDDSINIRLTLSVKFYKPNDECTAKRFVTFVSNDLVFFTNTNNSLTKDSRPMVLKQVNTSIPKCIFIPVTSTLDLTTKKVIEHVPNNSETESTNETVLQSRIQVKNINTLIEKPNKTSNFESNLSRCIECKSILSLSVIEHFQSINRPLTDDFKCKKCGLISTSLCALNAHIRTHDKNSPFVCPECGKQFVDWKRLDDHLEKICFHRAKTVRFKCPARKCGKVFAQTLTFSTHFPVAHMKIRFACSLCSDYFINEIEFEIHVKSHENSSEISAMKIHECTVCSTPVENIKQHVLNHVQDKDNRVFVFICRYCRSFYRSKITYATHILKCTKLLLNNQVKKEAQKNDIQCKVIKFCKFCSCHIHFSCTYKNLKSVTSSCPKCSAPFADDLNCKTNFEHTTNVFVQRDIDNDNYFCVLCGENLEIDKDDLFNYKKHNCKFKNPAIFLNKLSKNVLDSTIIANLDLPCEVATSGNRKRLLNGTFKYKNDLEEIIPEIFDGEYKCKFCTFTNDCRKSFHDHIQKHRDVSTSYQCMECGECFVVKPSLLKHLQVFHLIENVDSYLNENECFDKQAVKELEENMRMVPGELKEPLVKNQCRICRQVFSDPLELSKHFRVHGMAFLMKKIIK